MAQVEELAREVGTKPACESLGVARSSLYRHRRPVVFQGPRPRRPTPARALAIAERQIVLSTLHSTRFVDLSPAHVYHTLLGEKKYLCSIRTMHRILAAEGESSDRRNQLRHLNHPKPVLRATAPNQVWSWDITKLLGPVKWTYYYLYVVLDIFSRFVVAWMLSPEENGTLAKHLLTEAFRLQGVDPARIGVHMDRGAPMTSKVFTHKLAELGVTQSFSRPRVSNDNPFSESQFKTMKYRPEYPDRFGSFQDARVYCGGFFPWYNDEHRHSSLGYLTPAAVHTGQAEQLQRQRALVLAEAFARTPERFVRGTPRPPATPSEVWINPPAPSTIEVATRTQTEPDDRRRPQLP